MPLTEPASRANAVVEVACDEGKLSFDGVPTPTTTEGCSGRRRRTTLLRTTEVACAPKVPTPTIAQRPRRGGSTAIPAAARAIHPRACSPACENDTAVPREPGTCRSRRWIVARSRTSPEGTGISTLGSSAAPAPGSGFEDTTPRLLAHELGVRLTVAATHLGESAVELAVRLDRGREQVLGLRAVALAVGHPAPVRGGDRGAVDTAQGVPARLDRREIGLRHLVVDLVVLAQGVREAAGQGDCLAVPAARRAVDPRRPAGRRGQVHRRGDHHRVGVPGPHAADLGQRGGQQLVERLGPPEEVADRLDLDGDRRVLEAHEVLDQCLETGLHDALWSPSWYSEATTRRLRRW